MIESAGATLLYLPPYSPDLNPIENPFAKLKANLRKAAERTVNGLWDAVGRIVDTYTPAESTNYFVAAGYLQPDRLTLSRAAACRARRSDGPCLTERNYQR